VRVHHRDAGAGRGGWRRILPPLLSCLVLIGCGRQGAPPAKQGAGNVLPAVRYEAHLAAGATAPSGATMRNPHAGDQAVARNGALLFTTMNCDGCHGGGAAGWVGPSLADGRWRYGGTDGEVFSSIYFGRPRGMPAFGGVLGAEGVWTLVTYLRSLPPPADMPTESWQP
jgi:cytochrome c oxidase cbb3-type subunit III